jgi:glycine cleavage system transcriptional repressor
MQIVATLLGAGRLNLIAEISQVVSECRCTLIESRMTELGAEFAGHLMVEGNWNHIARFESALENLAARYALKIHMLRAPEDKPRQEDAIPYAVDVVAGESGSHLFELADFFVARHIKILDVSTSRPPAPYSGTPMFIAHLTVMIPPAMKIIPLRDEFVEFCDRQNLDAILEPVKR